MNEDKKNRLYKFIYIKYNSFIKNGLLYFTDTIFDYFDSTVTDEYEIAVLKIKDNYNYKKNNVDIIEIDQNKYIIGFLYPSEFIEKENTYNFKPFLIYNKELRLSSFTIVNDITIQKKNLGGDYDLNNIKKIIFNERNFDNIDHIFIIRVKELINI